jgi:hypothetical protein
MPVRMFVIFWCVVAMAAMAATHILPKVDAAKLARVPALIASLDRL